MQHTIIFALDELQWHNEHPATAANNDVAHAAAGTFDDESFERADDIGATHDLSAEAQLQPVYKNAKMREMFELIDQIGALNEATNSMIERTSELLKQQTGMIHEQASASGEECIRPFAHRRDAGQV